MALSKTFQQKLNNHLKYTIFNLINAILSIYVILDM